MRCLFARALAAGALAGCATVYEPGPGNLAQYCTPENAFRLGSEARAYLGVCPKETEAAFLAALERGRALLPSTPSVYPYIERMRQTEQTLLAAGSEAQREQLRGQLGDLEWWAVHLMNSPGSYGVGP